MAATDITGVVEATKAPYEFEQLHRDEVVSIDVLDADFVGIETVAAHKLVAVPEGKALVGAKVVVLEDITSGGAATVKFTIGGKDVSAAIAKAKLIQGAVIALPLDATGDNLSYAFDATAVTVNMTVGTAALTAGKFLLYLSYVDVAGVVENG